MTKRYISRRTLNGLTQDALLDIPVGVYDVLRPDSHSACKRLVVRVVRSPHQVWTESWNSRTEMSYVLGIRRESAWHGSWRAGEHIEDRHERGVAGRQRVRREQLTHLPIMGVYFGHPIASPASPSRLLSAAHSRSCQYGMPRILLFI